MGSLQERSRKLLARLGVLGAEALQLQEDAKGLRQDVEVARDEVQETLEAQIAEGIYQIDLRSVLKEVGDEAHSTSGTHFTSRPYFRIGQIAPMSPSYQVSEDAVHGLQVANRTADNIERSDKKFEVKRRPDAVQVAYGAKTDGPVLGFYVHLNTNGENIEEYLNKLAERFNKINRNPESNGLAVKIDWSGFVEKEVKSAHNRSLIYVPNQFGAQMIEAVRELPDYLFNEGSHRFGLQVRKGTSILPRTNLSFDITLAQLINDSYRESIELAKDKQNPNFEDFYLSFINRARQVNHPYFALTLK